PHNGFSYSSFTSITGGAVQVLDYDISGTELTLQEQTGDLYWDGDGFDSAGQVWLKASGLASWSYDVP
ncbi:MAG: hypothetical protein COT18_10850, partial [Elusimicrobia bacterium CG08_land_8_20_14_0_20_59_10]